jgi:hypothetical protein
VGDVIDQPDAKEAQMLNADRIHPSSSVGRAPLEGIFESQLQAMPKAGWGRSEAPAHPQVCMPRASFGRLAAPSHAQIACMPKIGWGRQEALSHLLIVAMPRAGFGRAEASLIFPPQLI